MKSFTGLRGAQAYTSLDPDPSHGPPSELTMRDIHPGSALPLAPTAFAGFSLDPATGVLGPRTRDLNTGVALPPRVLDMTLLSNEEQAPYAPGRVLPGAYADQTWPPVWISSYDRVPPKDLEDFRGMGAPKMLPVTVPPANPMMVYHQAGGAIRPVASPAMAAGGAHQVAGGARQSFAGEEEVVEEVVEERPRHPRRHHRKHPRRHPFVAREGEEVIAAPAEDMPPGMRRHPRLRREEVELEAEAPASVGFGEFQADLVYDKAAPTIAPAYLMPSRWI